MATNTCTQQGPEISGASSGSKEKKSQVYTLLGLGSLVLQLAFPSVSTFSTSISKTKDFCLVLVVPQIVMVQPGDGGVEMSDFGQATDGREPRFPRL